MKKMINTRISLAVCLLMSCAGCAVGPDYHRPDLALPAQHTEQPVTLAVVPADEPAQQFVATREISAQWWELFHSESLNALIQTALHNSPDLQAADAALRVAQQNLAAQRSAYFPTVDAQFTPTRQKIAGALASPASSNATIYNLHTAQLNVSYAVDVFGLNRRQVESLQALADMQAWQLRATYLTLTSNLVNAAINEAALRAQLRALQDVLDSQNKILTMVQRQVELGQAGQLDLAAQESAVANATSALAPVQKQLTLQRDQIKALAGKYPDDTGIAQFELSSLQLPGELPQTLPSTLVDRRPDILAAEAQLHAASAQIGVAVANRLPNITLGVNSYGSAAYQLGDLFKSGTAFWNLAGSVTAPIFDGGVLSHRQDAAQAAFDQAEAQYRSTVIAAFQNVADSLQAIQADTLALQAARNAEIAARKTFEIGQKQLQLGDVSPMALLTIEQNYRQAQVAYVLAQAARYSDTVALFQSLGGGTYQIADIGNQKSNNK
jgi:NodT family efflux transporter outer membrane factor (OMF) lipoprotein